MLTFKKILWSTDFSAASYVSLPVAANIARAYGAELALVHVVPFPAPNDEGATTEEAAERIERQKAEIKLNQIRNEQLVGITTCTLVLIGDPALEIVRAAQEQQTQLIVIAARGHAGWQQFLFGSVATAVLKVAHCPVLTVGRGTTAAENAGSLINHSRSLYRQSDSVSPTPLAAPSPWKKILCPIDFSESSHRALDAAGALAHFAGAELILVHVTNPPFSPPRTSWGEPLPSVLLKPQTEMRAAAERDLRHIIQHARFRPNETTTMVRRGVASEEILRVANEEAIDLIVMFENEHSGWRNLFIGSTAEQVLKGAPCPVLTVRKPDEKISTSALPSSAEIDDLAPARPKSALEYEMKNV